MNNDFYEHDQRYIYRLDFPSDLEEQVASGSLVIDLEVDTREEEGLWTLLFVDDTKATAAISNYHQMEKLQKILNRLYI